MEKIIVNIQKLYFCKVKLNKKWENIKNPFKLSKILYNLDKSN